jgi:hypothetical protein
MRKPDPHGRAGVHIKGIKQDLMSGVVRNVPAKATVYGHRKPYAGTQGFNRKMCKSCQWCIDDPECGDSICINIDSPYGAQSIRNPDGSCDEWEE